MVGACQTFLFRYANGEGATRNVLGDETRRTSERGAASSSEGGEIDAAIYGPTVSERPPFLWEALLSPNAQ